MSDARLRALEAAFARGEPGAQKALAAGLCRSGLHAWSLCEAGSIVCAVCREQRPHDGVEQALTGTLDDLRERHRMEISGPGLGLPFHARLNTAYRLEVGTRPCREGRCALCDLERRTREDLRKHRATVATFAL